MGEPSPTNITRTLLNTHSPLLTQLWELVLCVILQRCTVLPTLCSRRQSSVHLDRENETRIPSNLSQPFIRERKIDMIFPCNHLIICILNVIVEDLLCEVTNWDVLPCPQIRALCSSWIEWIKQCEKSPVIPPRTSRVKIWHHSLPK